MKKVIAYCGIVCSDCDVYIATMNDDNELRKKLAEQYTTENHTAKPEDFHCLGCLDIPEGCKIKQCAEEKKTHCAYCDDYACSKLQAHFEKSPNCKEVLGNMRGETK